MTAERWAQLKDLFEAVLERAPDERSSFLQRVCGGDGELRHELEQLLAGHAGAGSFLEERDGSPGPTVFQAGEVVGRRFKILRFIGSGGMGEVFEAEDLDLGGRVAVKAVRPGLASDERFVRRLIQETQLARKVTHPNVCRVFDIERHAGPSGEIVFLTMEFLDGETLAERLRREGPLTAEQALPVVRQLTAALDAAHAAGVIHRDFKSANVSLTCKPNGETRAVVMDFGLARPAECAPGHSLTGTGHLIGTLAYMSPEQLDGGEATAASDIYALGVVMHEMLTGRRPAGGFEPFGPWPSPVAGHWMPVIQRALERSPSARFPTASAMLPALELRATTRKAWFTWRALGIKWAALAVLLMAVLLAGLYCTGRWNTGSATLLPGSYLLLTNVTNSTGDPELNALDQLMRDQLNQSARFNLWNPRNMAGVLERMGRKKGDEVDAKVMREIALREGLPIVVFWTVSHPGDGYVLNMRLEKPGSDAGSPEMHWDFAAPANSKQALFDSVRDAAKWIRLNAGEAAGEISAHDRASQDVTTASWDALVSFSAAEKEKAAGHPAEAIQMLDRALQLDPNFALAHMRLADIYINLRQQEQGFQHWRIALGESNRTRLSKRESYRIRGLYAMDTEDLAAGEAVFTAMSREYPFDYLAAFYLGAAQRMQGKTEPAIATFQRAASIDPKQYYTYVELTKCYLVLKKFVEAGRELVRIRGLGEQATADQFEGALRFLSGDLKGAADLFVHLLNSADPSAKSRGYLLLASLAAESGRPSEALTWLHDGIEYDRARGDLPFQADKLLNIAYLHEAGGLRSRARAEVLEAVRLDNSPERLLKAGVLLARAGFLLEASDMASRARQFDGIHKAEVAGLRIDGEVLAAKRQFTPALDRLTAAAKQDQVAGYQEYLARTYAVSGDLERAAFYYQRVFEAPALPWMNSATDFPGIWADCALEYIRLEQRLGHKDVAEKLLSIYDNRHPVKQSEPKPKE